MKCIKLEPGEHVLVRQKAFKGKHKISDRWGNSPYWVIKCIGEPLLGFKVQLVGENAKIRTLHWNLLFPLALENESYDIQQNLEKKNLN